MGAMTHVLRTAAHTRELKGALHGSEQAPDDMARITTPELAQAFIDEQVAAVRKQIGDKKVLLAFRAALTAPSSQRCSSKPSANSSSACT